MATQFGFKPKVAARILEALQTIERAGGAVSRVKLTKEFGSYIIWRMKTKGFIRVDGVHGSYVIKPGYRFKVALKQLKKEEKR